MIGSLLKYAVLLTVLSLGALRISFLLRRAPFMFPNRQQLAAAAGLALGAFWLRNPGENAFFGVLTVLGILDLWTGFLPFEWLGAAGILCFARHPGIGTIIIWAVGLGLVCGVNGLLRHLRQSEYGPLAAGDLFLMPMLPAAYGCLSGGKMLSLASILFGLATLTTKKRKSLPFAPFLLFACGMMIRFLS